MVSEQQKSLSFHHNLNPSQYCCFLIPRNVFYQLLLILFNNIKCKLFILFIINAKYTRLIFWLNCFVTFLRFKKGKFQGKFKYWQKISHLSSERLLLMTRQGLLQTQMGHDFNEKFVSDSHWEIWPDFIPQQQILYYFSISLHSG